MISASERQNVLATLKSVVNHLRSFGPDQQGFITRCYPQTELKTQLVARLIEADRYLADSDNTALSKDFQTVKSRFIAYIENKIRSIESSSPGAPPLNHVQDVLFATKMLTLPEWRSIPGLLDKQREELRQLRRESLLAYEAILMKKRNCSQTDAHTLLHPLRVELLNLEKTLGSPSDIEPLCIKITQLSDQLFKEA